MHLLKRSVVFQVALFTFFIFLGARYILKELVSDSLVFQIVEISFLSLIAIGGVIAVMKTKKDEYLIVDRKPMILIRISLYGVALGLIIGLLGNLIGDYSAYFRIIAGAVLAIFSLLGLYVSIKIISKDEDI
jgi:hypothetical protein